MVKYIKAFIKTVKQMDKFERYSMYAISLMILGIVLVITFGWFFDVSALVAFCYLLGAYFAIVGSIDSFKELFEAFIEKVKKNI